MVKVKSNFTQLLLDKQQSEGRRITARQVALATGLKDYTVYAFANNTLKEYPGDALAKLCVYFNCGVGDLLVLSDETPSA